jgi:hypothetical protein
MCALWSFETFRRGLGPADCLYPVKVTAGLVMYRCTPPNCLQKRLRDHTQNGQFQTVGRIRATALALRIVISLGKGMYSSPRPIRIPSKRKHEIMKSFVDGTDLCSRFIRPDECAFVYGMKHLRRGLTCLTLPCSAVVTVSFSVERASIFTLSEIALPLNPWSLEISERKSRQRG